MTYQELKKVNKELKESRDSQRMYKWLTYLAIIYIRSIENQLLGNNHKVIEGFYQKVEMFEKEKNDITIEKLMEYHQFFTEMVNKVNAILNSIVFDEDEIERKVKLIKSVVKSKSKR